ncbi:MAG: hypothetical protein JRG89_01870 [Deltaproteobacteria bacterium]|nr:hypothetical protein [Deltaproteobacteria bacterium]MBW2723076.1 hypothetical protein [Deltaproteobacteria bacterium]
MLSTDIESASRVAGAGMAWVAPLLGLMVLILGPGPVRAEDDAIAIAIATLIPYAEKAEVRDSIRQDCGLSSKLSKFVVARSVKKKIPMIRLGNLNEALSARDEGSSGEPGSSIGNPSNLELRITDAIQTSGGLLPTHSLSIDGVFKKDGRIAGTFVATRFARASFIPFRRGECAILSEAAVLLAKDVVRWIKKPSLDSRLGDAR